MTAQNVLVNRRGRFAIYSKPKDATKFISGRLNRVENLLKWKIEEYNRALLNAEKSNNALNRKFATLSMDVKMILKEIKLLRK